MFVLLIICWLLACLLFCICICCGLNCYGKYDKENGIVKIKKELKNKSKSANSEKKGSDKSKGEGEEQLLNMEDEEVMMENKME